MSDVVIHWLVLSIGGFIAGLLAGLLGIGGGTILVPVLMGLNYTYAQAVATSSLAIVLTSLSGTIQNYCMGVLQVDRILMLGFSGIITAFYSAKLVAFIPKYLLEFAFGILMWINLYLTHLKEQLTNSKSPSNKIKLTPLNARILTGGAAGFLAGLFGVGGGVIMVPFQMLWLNTEIKPAIQTSLGVIVLTSIMSCWGHAQEGNVLYLQGFVLGIGGLIGAQITTRYLPKLPDNKVKQWFSVLLISLSGYFFFKAFYSYLSLK